MSTSFRGIRKCHSTFLKQKTKIFMWFILVCVSRISLVVSGFDQAKAFEVREGEKFVHVCSTELLSDRVPIHGFDIQWYLNGNQVEVDPNRERKYFFIQGDRIEIFGVEKADQGNWEIRKQIFTSSMENSNDIWCNFTLKVHQKMPILSRSTSSISDKLKSSAPRFIRLKSMQKMESVVKIQGESVTFKCNAQGYPKPEINWTRNGFAIERSRVLTMKKWSLTLKHLRIQDSGKYACTVFNTNGNATFTFDLFVVEKKPRPLHMEDLKLLPGETARLNCSMVLQDHSFHIEWLRRAEVNGSYVDSTGAPLFEVLEVDDSDGRDTRVLSIENVTSEDNGQYFCKDKDGTSAHSAWLITVETNDASEAQSQSTISYLNTGIFCGVAVCATLIIFAITIKLLQK